MRPLGLLRIVMLVAIAVLLAVFLQRPRGRSPAPDSGPGLQVAENYVGGLATALTRYRDSTGDWPGEIDDMAPDVIRDANATLPSEHRPHVSGPGAWYSSVYQYQITYHCCEWSLKNAKSSDSHACSDPVVPRFSARRTRGRRHVWNWRTASWQTDEYGEPVPEPQVWSFSSPDDSNGWAAGNHGWYARTTDGGRTCSFRKLSKGSTLFFADVQALSPSVVFLLAADDGLNPPARIYRTGDAGTTWQLLYTGRGLQPIALRFWDAEHGIALAKPETSTGVDDAWMRRDREGLDLVAVLRTDDGGKNWERVRTLPAMLPGEHAMEHGLAVYGDRYAWFGTYAKRDLAGRVFRTADRGLTWSAADTPAMPSDGVDHVAFRDTLNGVATACGFQLETYVMQSRDGGRTWTMALRTKQWGQYCYELGYRRGASQPLLTLRSAGRTRYSADDGKTWTVVDSTLYGSIAPAKPWRTWVRRGGWAMRWAPALTATAGR